MPFVSPSRWRGFISAMSHVDDKVIRVFGLFFMLLGLGLLYLIN